MKQVKNSFDTKRFILVLLAFIAGGVVPIQLVTLSFGYAQIVKGIPKGKEMMATAHDFALDYLFYIYIPALIALFVIALYSRKKYPDLFLANHHWLWLRCFSNLYAGFYSSGRGNL